MTAEAVKASYRSHQKNSFARRKERTDKLNAYKLSKGCIDCGYAENPVALDFDHRDPEQKIRKIAEMRNYSWKRILAELDKCDIRCANCHRIKTYNLNQTQRRRAVPDDSVSDGPHA